MANGVTIKIDGLDKLKKQLGSFPQHIKQEVDAELAAASNEFVNRAVLAAPVDVGILRHGISFERKKEMEYEVISSAHYSAYMEWGTITKVKVPSELSAYASQFKGRGVRKTGGIAPRPFFFVQIPFVEKFLNQNLKDTVAKALSK